MKDTFYPSYANAVGTSPLCPVCSSDELLLSLYFSQYPFFSGSSHSGIVYGDHPEENNTHSTECEKVGHPLGMLQKRPFALLCPGK